jgi:SAM-dependent methyltransferase
MSYIFCSCPACDADAAKVVAELDHDKNERFIAFSNKKYSGLLAGWLREIKLVVMRCEQCGHCWYREQPSDHQLSQMYAAGIPLDSTVSISRDPSDRMLFEMRRLKSLVNLRAPSYLDYGSGFGRWARAAVQVGFRVHAFEPSAKRGAEPDTPFALVHELDALGKMKFDVIQMEQVLEHVPDPAALLRDVRVFCHANTVLRVTVPNILRCEEGANVWNDWPFDGKRPHVMAPFEHLHGFTPRSLNELIKRSGYTTLPFFKLLSHYPLLSIRNVINRIYPAAGQTMVLMKPNDL